VCGAHTRGGGVRPQKAIGVGACGQGSAGSCRPDGGLNERVNYTSLPSHDANEIFDPTDLLLTGEARSQADQPNNLVEGPPM
jgi:hypothetical protein